MNKNSQRRPTPSKKLQTFQHLPFIKKRQEYFCIRDSLLGGKKVPIRYAPGRCLFNKAVLVRVYLGFSKAKKKSKISNGNLD